MVELSNEVMQLDYIDLGEFTPEQIATCSEFNRIWDITTPTLVSIIPSETFIMIGGLLPYDKFTYIDKIPEGVKKVRNFYGKGFSVIDIIFSPKDIMLYFLCPSNIVTSSTLIKDFIVNNLSGTMLNFDITIKNEQSIGCLDMDDSQGIPKRIIHYESPKDDTDTYNNVFIVGIHLVFDNHVPLMTTCFKELPFKTICSPQLITFADLCHEGFLSMYPSLDRIAVANEVAVQFAKSLNIDVNPRPASAIELESLNNLSGRLNNDDWIINANHPDVITKVEPCNIKPPAMQYPEDIDNYPEYKAMLEALPRIGDLK